MYPIVRQILKQKTGNMITSDILATFKTKCSHDYKKKPPTPFLPHAHMHNKGLSIRPSRTAPGTPVPSESHHEIPIFLPGPFLLCCRSLSLLLLYYLVMPIIYRAHECFHRTTTVEKKGIGGDIAACRSSIFVGEYKRIATL